MAIYNNVSDFELSLLLKNGDKEAFTEIYNRYWPLLFLHIRRMLDDDDLAEDVLQDLFTWIWNQSGHLEFTISLKAYLYTSVRNRVFDQIKHKKLKANRLEVFAASVEKATDMIDEQLSLKELIAEIDAEIMRMPEKMQEIFELSRVSHLSHKEIAEKLNISEHTVRKQVQRALKLLRKRLSLPEATVLILVYLNSR